VGYRGLLLNDPYKIDSMMGCVCGYSSYSVYLILGMFPRKAKRTRCTFERKDLKMWATRV
jgi:hypothetical protein